MPHDNPPDAQQRADDDARIELLASAIRDALHCAYRSGVADGRHIFGAEDPDESHRRMTQGQDDADTAAMKLWGEFYRQVGGRPFGRDSRQPEADRNPRVMGDQTHALHVARDDTGLVMLRLPVTWFYCPVCGYKL